MEELRQEARDLIGSLPESVTIEDIVYELYVTDNVKKRKKTPEQNETISIEDLKREMQAW